MPTVLTRFFTWTHMQKKHPKVCSNDSGFNLH